MNAGTRRWCETVLIAARDAFPESIDLMDIHMFRATQARHVRHMGTTKRREVRALLTELGLATYNPHLHTLTATPPPAGARRDDWIRGTWRDIKTATQPREGKSIA